jgi:hypothetical protein
MKRALHFLLAAILFQGSLALLGAELQSNASGQSGSTAQTGAPSPAATSTQSGQSGSSAPATAPAASTTPAASTASSPASAAPAPPSGSGASSQGAATAAPVATGKGTPAGASAQSLTQMPAPFDPTKELVILPRGSVLHVKLSTTLTSKTNKSGDKFSGMVTQPVVANDKTLVPEGSIVDGHVVMVKSSGRVAGRASMRIVLDHINTPDDVNFMLNADLQDLATSTCTKGIGDSEGTIKGCGKSKKSAAEAAGIAGGIGAASGASIGATEDMICRYYGCPGQDPNILKDAGIGAAIGGGTALMYSLLRHEKQVVLVSGSDLTFVVDRTVEQQPSDTPASSQDKS